MDQTLGAYTMIACQRAMDDAGVTPDQVDGIICCQSTIAGASGGAVSNWAPRPYLDPPYDSEWGLTRINAKWLVEQMELPSIKYAPDNVPSIGEMVGLAAQAVGDGQCHTTLVIYPTGNLEGRYRREEKTPRTTPKEAASGPFPGGTTAATISSTSSPTNSIAANTGEPTTTWPPL